MSNSLGKSRLFDLEEWHGRVTAAAGTAYQNAFEIVSIAKLLETTEACLAIDRQLMHNDIVGSTSRRVSD